ncbi:MAG: hypothetical protein BMS9Abin37_1657 [Acidobacteriota bacterium]|nr:MAG: hypothetical protein BMS9Abin37_1657 [Acidobacteriota bacterium]
MKCCVAANESVSLAEAFCRTNTYLSIYPKTTIELRTGEERA